MTLRTSFSLFAALLTLAVTSIAHGASIGIKPGNPTIGVGNTVSLTIVADFSDEPTIGGGIDVFFDNSALQFESFEFFAPDIVGDDPAFRRDPDLLAGELNGIGFGNFDGLGGASQVGVITFTALTSGLTLVTLGINEGGPPSNPGGFFNLDGAAQVVDLHGAKVTVVPLPAGFVLLASGLLAMGRMRRRV